MTKITHGKKILYEILDYIPVGVIMLGVHGVVLLSNEKASEILGINENLFLGKPFLSLFKNQEKKKLKKFIVSINNNSVATNSEIVQTNVKGKGTRYINIIAAHMSKHAVNTGLLVILQDQTDKITAELQRKQYEDEMQNSRNMLHSVIEGLHDGIFVKDKNGKYMLINSSGADLLGKTVSEVINNTPKDLFTVPNAKRITKTDKHILKTGETVTYEEYIGNKVFLTTKGLYTDHKGNVSGILGISRDITQKKEIEKRKDDFISIASHELKTPVTSIKAFTQILKKRVKSLHDDTVDHYLLRMETQLNKLTSLINGLLDVSKIQKGKLDLHEERFDFDDLLQETIGDLQYTTETHTLVKVGAAHKQIKADKDRLGQVVINLISNAVKYSPNSNKVVITSSYDKNKIVVGVQDFGIGIPKGYHHNIFERFYRVEGTKQETFSGLGVGLYISSEIIKRHKGKIWVDSDSKHGSTFYFQLPVN